MFGRDPKRRLREALPPPGGIASHVRAHSVQKVSFVLDDLADHRARIRAPCRPLIALWNVPAADVACEAQQPHISMNRVLICMALALSINAVVAFDPMSDAPASAQAPALTNASWFSDDDWALVATVVAMAIIMKRRKR